jgi:2-succinyl-5-enolpyruvyl-6-hydroxy-3-cyclohexene-1-carboxylate synthase
VIDERAAAFVALGIAKSTGEPVAVTCTSGTAAANLLPAVVEAHEARVPLIVMTADRPPELRGVGAGQAIDQVKLYGTFAKWFVEVGNHEPTRETAVHFRALACRAYATARGDRPGPVHLNFPLREPLAPEPEELDPGPWQGRPGGPPWVDVNVGDPGITLLELFAFLADDLLFTTRGVVVGGANLRRLAAAAVARLAGVLGWPLLAEPTSGLRCGPDGDAVEAIAHYEVLLRGERFAGEMTPELVLRVGDTPTSQALRAWLGRTRQVVVDPHGDWHEPTRTAERLVRADPAAFCDGLAHALEGREPSADPAWLSRWREADALVPPRLAAAPDPFEPKIWNAVAEAAPEGSTLFVASSMAIRDVEALLPRTAKQLTVLANRGANGIDGTVSSAVGAALGLGQRTYVLIGDLALLHDVGGLLAARRLGAELTVVCANNGGGGIFDFLPVSRAADERAYEEHIATPADVDVADLAALAGLPYVLASAPADVKEAVQSPAVVEVRTNRAENVRLHREVYARVAAALA